MEYSGYEKAEQQVGAHFVEQVNERVYVFFHKLYYYLCITVNSDAKISLFKVFLPRYNLPKSELLILLSIPCMFSASHIGASNIIL